MLEPQSTALFLLLMAVFGGLVACVVIAKQPVFRLLAACLAFIPAMLFGVAAVNKYYGYYETWSAVISDFTGGGVQTIPAAAAAGPGSAQQFDTLLGSRIDTQQAAVSGAEFNLKITGAQSKVTRSVLIYLPPQYFQQQYANYRFPAIELIHGQPGSPEDWLAALTVDTTLQNLLVSHSAQPVVLVMPDVNGARTVSLQCVNQVDGVADDTFTAFDVPDFVASRLRVQPPGPAWGIAGFSEGGYCAANLALRHPQRYGYAGVLSGYFIPMANRVEVAKNVIKHVDPFHGNLMLRLENSPLYIASHLPLGSRIPQFWIGVARADRQNMLAAQGIFGLLRARDPGTRLLIVPNGAHNAVAWRSMIPPMLEWMTVRLTEAATAQQGCAGCATTIPAGGPGPSVHASTPQTSTAKPPAPGPTHS